MTDRMPNFFRFLFALAALPTCWGVTRAFVDALLVAAESSKLVGAETISLVGGIVVFILIWVTAPHPVKTYVLGHELTHALWGMLFLARPHDVRVTARGGSVKLSKTNVFITLAPYFFPFYTFIVIVVALVVRLCMGTLPCLPIWMFFVGLTWAFHFLFTLETLAQHQPDVKMYGRLFSWLFIYLANVLQLAVFLALTTALTFSDLARLTVGRVVGVHRFLFDLVSSCL